MSNPRIIYTPCPDATPEGETTTLANIYSFVIRCAEERNKGGCGATPDQATRQYKARKQTRRR